jgi:hypothetical protein
MAQSPELLYQERGGGFKEGIQSTESTGESLILIGALVDSPKSERGLPKEFYARFYLPDTRVPNLTIRETNSRYNYWLSDVSVPWRPQAVNSFVWATARVVRRLNYEEGPLELKDLSATVRLGRFGYGSLDEDVAPVELTSSQMPRTVTGYRFVFLPNRGMRLQIEVLADKGGSGEALEPATRFEALADTPVTFAWKAGSRAEGWYRLKVTGYLTGSNAGNKPILRSVRFYHRRLLP